MEEKAKNEERRIKEERGKEGERWKKERKKGTKGKMKKK